MNEDIIEKIKKLLRLSNSSNINESEIAFAKAMEMASKHRISLDEITIDEDESVSVKTFKGMGAIPFARRLAHGVLAAYFNVDVVTNTGKRLFYFFGRPSDIEIAWYVCGRLMQAYSKSLREYRDANRECYGNKTRDFTCGWFYAICRKMNSEKERLEIEDSRFAIVLASDKSKRQKKIESSFEVVKDRKLKAPKSLEKDSFAKGYLAGRNTNIYPAIKSNCQTSGRLK